MRVLVTGGKGFIGSVLTTTLAKKGYRVVVYDLVAENTGTQSVQYVKGDIFDVDHLTEILKECDAVIHMVGLPNAQAAQQHPQVSFDLNVRSLHLLLEAMRNTGTNRLVFPSSAAIYGAVDHSPVTEEAPVKPRGIYGYHKYAAERLAEAYSFNYVLRATILRLFNVYGEGGAGILNVLVEKAGNGEPVKLYAQEQRRDFIHVSDTSNAFAHVLELDHTFEVYNVGTGVGRRIDEVVHLVKDYFPTLSVEQASYEGILYDSVADIAKLKNATGFSPDASDNRIRQAIEDQMRLRSALRPEKTDKLLIGYARAIT